jgi:hypothetical protein
MIPPVQKNLGSGGLGVLNEHNRHRGRLQDAE